jgi:hypothetical protein
MPASCGLLQICAASPSSQFAQSQSEIADSLWRIFEIFPFLGDSDAETGFDLYCVPDRAVDFALYLNCFGIPGSGLRHIQDAYGAPLIIAEQLDQMIASLRQGHVDQTARSDAMCAGDDKTCPEFELHHRNSK